MLARRLVIAGAMATLVVPLTTASTASAHGRERDLPATIDLPEGFAGEGVALGSGKTFYAGSRADGRIATGDLREGVSSVFVSSPLVPFAAGLEADRRHDLLWVAGGGTGMVAVYDLDTGAGIAAVTLTTAAAFINDVVVTRDAAYFTNSASPEIYRVPVAHDGTIGTPETIALSGPAADDHVAGAFNLNGIEATRDGRTLVAVNSALGTLYTIDPTTGVSARIDLGGATVRTGDGILLEGHTLYVLQNGNPPEVAANEIVVIELRDHLTTGRVVDRITSPLFETATTLAKRGPVIVAVNAQFAGAPIDPGSELVLVRAGDHCRGRDRG